MTHTPGAPHSPWGHRRTKPSFFSLFHWLETPSHPRVPQKPPLFRPTNGSQRRPKKRTPVAAPCGAPGMPHLGAHPRHHVQPPRATQPQNLFCEDFSMARNPRSPAQTPEIFFFVANRGGPQKTQKGQHSCTPLWSPWRGPLFAHTSGTPGSPLRHCSRRRCSLSSQKWLETPSHPSAPKKTTPFLANDWVTKEHEKVHQCCTSLWNPRQAPPGCTPQAPSAAAQDTAAIKLVV